ncbi:cytochrome P450 2U1-like [Littorina saxatilis]|uniref:cytochrome P450 2U1-like n=1 Tax=Littorina saxatilis TaxID=31220 RepID=UPI0038B4A437
MFAFNAVDFQRLLKVFTTDDHHNYIQQQTERQIDCNRRLLNWHKDTYDPASLRDFTDQLLLYVESGEDSGLLTKDDLDHILLDLAGSGFQATAVTLTWLLGYMALNQDVQGEVHKEIDAVVGRDRLPSLEDQPYLPLTEAVMCEVQRLASVRPFLTPHRTRKGTVIQGYDIPRDTLVLFNVWGLHHDARYWPHPSRFNPYRFLNEDKVVEIPDHFMPYGAGTRQCPGESLADVQLFLFFTAIMHQLRALPAHPNMTLEGALDHLLRPKPFCVKVEARD